MADTSSSNSPTLWETTVHDMPMSPRSGMAAGWQNFPDPSRIEQGVPQMQDFLDGEKMRLLERNPSTLRNNSASLEINFHSEAPEFAWTNSHASSPHPQPFPNSFRRPSLDSAIGSVVMDTPLHSPDMGRKSFYSPDFRHYPGRFDSSSPRTGYRGYYADSGFDSSEYQVSPFMGHDFPEDTLEDCGLMGKMFPDLPAYSPPSRENSDSQESTFAMISASGPPQLVSVPSYTPTRQLSREACEIIMNDIITPTMHNPALQTPAVKSMLSSAATKIESGEVTTLRDLENLIMMTPTKVRFSAMEYVCLCTYFLKNCKDVWSRLPLLDQTKPDEPVYDASYFARPLETMKSRLVEVFGFPQKELDSISIAEGSHAEHDASRVVTGGSTHKPEPVSPPPTPQNGQRRSIPDSSAPGPHCDALPASANMSHTSKDMMSQQPNIILSNPVGRAVSRTHVPSTTTTRLSDMIPNTPTSFSSPRRTSYIGQPRSIRLGSTPAAHGSTSPVSSSRDEALVSPTNSANEHQCTQCTKTFSRQCDLRKHLKTHERPHKCHDPKCKFFIKGFSAEKDRDRHWHDRHEPNAKKIGCRYPDCSYSSTRESNVKQHMEKTHGYNYVRTKQVQKRAKSDSPSTAADSNPTKRKSVDTSADSRKRHQLATPATPMTPPIDVSSASTSPHTLGHSPVEQSLMFPPAPQPTPITQSISPALMVQDHMQSYFDTNLRGFAQPADAVRAITRQVHTPLTGTIASPPSAQHKTFENGDATLIDEYQGSSDEEFHRNFFSDAPPHVRGLFDELPSPTQAYPIVREPFNHELDASLQ